MLPKNRPPTSPGEVLAEEFLKPMEMTQSALAVKLSRVFDTTSLFWANLQTNVDLWNAERKLARAD